MIQRLTPSVLPLLRSVEVIQDRFGVRVERALLDGEPVLVKTLTADFPEMRARFHREGEIAARLDHPNIVPLVAHAETQLAFRFIEGGTLRAELEKRVFDVREGIALARGILAAIGHAHGRGVTHLDLKPENILLENGRVRVTDFGLSHDAGLPRITARGDRLGTPHYMAPEQFKGQRGDPRSDLYSVGVILFECLTGTPPFYDPFRWLAGLPTEREALPPYVALHELLNAALSRDPDARPSSALAFLIALEKAEAALP
ncbi:serine/threonine-protein kinase [Deinococcus yavapaiensis]|uniref:serine/threonine-protein kinase n=1 Tax=Deinococcus yavapaiensis TaxID=309889 RepID=UPI001FE4C4EA|nr:serine/threonine-protein kinase [Deinococcus yavapaiensis]